MTQVHRANEHLRRVMDIDDYSPDWRMQFYVSSYIHTQSTFRELRRCFLKKRIIGVKEESEVRERSFGKLSGKKEDEDYK
ncbi:Phosphoglycerate mutase-like protein AT74 [Glycine soja]